MANTYTLISSNLLSSSAASVTFSAIPSTYTDLVLRITARSTTASTRPGFYISMNGSASNHTTRTVGYDVTTAYSDSWSSRGYFFVGNISGSTATSNTFGVGEIYIPNYAGSTTKQVGMIAQSENNSTSVAGAATAGLFNSTAAISSLVITTDGNLDSGSSFYLYGIKNS